MSRGLMLFQEASCCTLILWRCAISHQESPLRTEYSVRLRPFWAAVDMAPGPPATASCARLRVDGITSFWPTRTTLLRKLLTWRMTSGVVLNFLAVRLSESPRDT